MLCAHSENCLYFRAHCDNSSSKQHRLLVESYCEGQLQSKCRRILYEEEFCKEAPEELAPNGYLVGTHKKLRVEETRKHRRHIIKNGTCLLQIPDSKKTFSAEVIDLSEGGLKLEVKIDLKELTEEPEPDVLKIIGHTMDDSPLPITQELIKMVWQNNQFIGCCFVPSPV